MNNPSSQPTWTELESLQLRIHRARQNLASLTALDDAKLRGLIGRMVLENLRKPEARAIAKLVLPTLRKKPAELLRKALEATEDPSTN